MFSRLTAPILISSAALMLSACGDEMPGPRTPVEGEETDYGDCPQNERWDAKDEACVCVETHVRESGRCTPDTSLTACLLISGTDWATSGSLSVFDLSTNMLLEDLTTYHQDSVLRVLDGKVYVVQRMFGDSVIRLNPAQTYGIEWEESVRQPNSRTPNPHDLVRHGSYLYLTLYNEGRIIQAHANPLSTGAFLTGKEARISPETWDGGAAEATRLAIVDGTLFALVQGLRDSWNCGSMDGDDNRSRIYAFDVDTLEEAPVFEGNQSYKTLEFCNASGWTFLESGEVLVHSVGDYRQYGANADDGGLEVFDLREPHRSSVVHARESAFSADIFGAFAQGDDVYVTLVGEDPTDIRLHRLDTSTPGAWTLAGEALYRGNIWDLQILGDELFIVDRHYGFEGVVRRNRFTGEVSGKDILTPIAPESIQVLRRPQGCW